MKAFFVTRGVVVLPFPTEVCNDVQLEKTVVMIKLYSASITSQCATNVKVLKEIAKNLLSIDQMTDIV